VSRSRKTERPLPHRSRLPGRRSILHKGLLLALLVPALLKLLQDRGVSWVFKCTVVESEVHVRAPDGSGARNEKFRPRRILPRFRPAAEQQGFPLRLPSERRFQTYQPPGPGPSGYSVAGSSPSRARGSAHSCRRNWVARHGGLRPTPRPRRSPSAPEEARTFQDHPAEDTGLWRFSTNKSHDNLCSIESGTAHCQLPFGNGKSSHGTLPLWRHFRWK